MKVRWRVRVTRRARVPRRSMITNQHTARPAEGRDGTKAHNSFAPMIEFDDTGVRLILAVIVASVLIGVWVGWVCNDATWTRRRQGK